MEGDVANWLLFPDKASAEAAIGIIDDSKNYPVDAAAVTQTWAIARPTAAGAWAVPKCRDEDMTGVAGYTLAAAVEWPADPGMGG